MYSNTKNDKNMLAEQTQYKTVANVEHIILMVSESGPEFRDPKHIVFQMSLALAEKGFNVGVLDIDFMDSYLLDCFRIRKSKIHQTSEGWIPHEIVNNSSFASGGSLKFMSINLPKNTNFDLGNVRGVEKEEVIKQLIFDVVWTTDRPLVVVDSESLEPQKLINSCRKNNIKILGLIEDNREMDACFCGFSWSNHPTGSILTLCKKLNINFLGSVSDIEDCEDFGPSYNEEFDYEYERTYLIEEYFYHKHGQKDTPMREVLNKLFESN
ncbi:CFD1 [Candida jiufengensis]|uniref:CFD1 n=1 Tax=Candida jiufengensis TaxID=497108 RepID=UPI002224CD80|nr:CFD1 [Candida jiufengensis]KAI5952309.1 CFD1 [Candida jiufengensis]